MADAIEIAKLVVADRDGIYTELEDMFARIILARNDVVDAAVAAHTATKAFWERSEEDRDEGDLAEVARYEMVEQQAVAAYVRATRETKR